MTSGWRRRARRWAIAAAVAVVLCVVVNSVLLCESALRVMPQLRGTPAAELADSIAQETHATWEDVSIRAADGAILRGWWFVPPKPGPAAVIALHGIGDTRSGMAAHTRMLLRHHFAVLAPDSRGHGGSGGDLVSYGLRETGDVQRWNDWMAGRQIRQVYGVGQSMGGSILLQSLAVEPRFRAVVADCPFADFREIAYDRLHIFLGLPRPLAWFFVEPGLFYGRARYGLDLRQVRPVEKLRNTRIPVLLIHGTEDRNVPPRHSRILHAANPATGLWEVRGARHVASIGTEPEAYEEKVVEWFRKHP